MTTDNAKPTVITAAEFVAGGYADKVAAGECAVIMRGHGLVSNVHLYGDRNTYARISYVDMDYKSFDIPGKAKLIVQWEDTPATAPAVDADKVARLRAALKSIIAVVVPAERFERKVYDASPELDVYTDVLRIARAALETGEVEA